MAKGDLFSAHFVGGQRWSEMIRSLTKDLPKATDDALVAGSKKANQVSQSGFKYRRKGTTPPRPGRTSTQGKMTKHVKWKVNGSNVELDVNTLNKRAPHWIIQEIGTGQRATMTRAGQRHAQGRMSKADQAKYVRTVKSQRGRKISATLAFGTAPGGTFVPAGAGSGQQLYRRRDLTGLSPFRVRRITIQKEIVGQHFVRDGGREGFRVYRQTVLAAARRTFAAQKRRG